MEVFTVLSGQRNCKLSGRQIPEYAAMKNNRNFTLLLFE
jgi:hypothetical protein